MRQSGVVLCPSSRHRLLTLLLTLLLGYIGSYTVNASPANLGNISQLTGGTPFIRTYLLISRCSERSVQMKRGTRKKALDALGLQQSKTSLLQFESHPQGGGLFRIQGNYSQKYICFNKKGRLIVREDHANSDQCVFQEFVEDNYTMLRSAANPKWHVGFNKSGKKLKGFQIRQRKRRKCFHFTKKAIESKFERSKEGPFANADVSRGFIRVNR